MLFYQKITFFRSLVMIGQVPVRFYWLVMVVGMSGECMGTWSRMLKIYPSLWQFQRLDQAINSDVARALFNIPMGKVDQLSWSTRQYWSHLNKRVKRELCCQLFNSWFKKFLDQVAWSRKLIKKIASVTGA